MRIQNTSQYPDDEVRQLVEFGMTGVGTTGVAVHVKNSKHSYSGMAYSSVPTMSPRFRQRSVRNLITLKIGAPDKFPRDNMVEKLRWVEIPDDKLDEVSDDPDGGHTYQGQKCHRIRSGVRGSTLRNGDGALLAPQKSFLQVGMISRHPYGGKRSPLIMYNNWREALVGVSAHEARHVYQFRTGKRVSEVDCERFALKRLEAYRESLKEASSEKQA